MKTSTVKRWPDFFIRIAGITLLLSIPRDPQLRRIVFDRWKSWLVPKPSGIIRVEIKASRAPRSLVKKLRLFPGRKYDFVFPTHQSVCLVKLHGNNSSCQIFAEKNIKTVLLYHGCIEPLIHTLLRRLGLFPLHGSGVAQNRRGVIALGESGSGKSTLAAHLLTHGFNPLSDDAIILSRGKSAPLALGGEKGVFIHSRALSRFRVLQSLSPVGQKHSASGLKKLLAPPITTPLTQAAVKMVLFPVVKKNSPSGLVKLNHKQALIKLLTQSPDSWSHYLNDYSAIKRLFALYYQLSKNSSCYKVILGQNLRATVKRIVSLAESPGKRRDTSENQTI